MMSLMVNNMKNNKSLVTIQIVDIMGNPIVKAQYQVKNQKTGQVIAAGPTNQSGCIVQISRDKGTILDVYIKSMFSNQMQVVKSFALSKDRMVVRIISPKILLDFKTLFNQGEEGQYKRKTYTVKKGDTLSSIAKNNNTSVRFLINFNNIKNPDSLSIGQVIKLPVNISETGNKISSNKEVQNKVKPKVESDPQKNTGIIDKIGSATSRKIDQASKQLNEWYEEAVKEIESAAKAASQILTVEDRSENGGTPKVNAENLCKTNPQCISGGKSELIREINIRLAGFGGALPTDEFTELTGQCIKQFQRDYMGVPETGKICGSLIIALDKFYEEYPIASFMGKAQCPCGKCSGFGSGRRNVQSGTSKAIEYPGIHRSLIWMLKSVSFYLKNEFKNNKLEVSHIESGYRCIDNNKKNGRTSVNHMGLALDVHFNKNGERTRELSDMEFIRKNVFSNKMKAKEQRQVNRIYLEPKIFNNGSSGATTWVHFDITLFLKDYFLDDLFKKNVSDLNGKKIVDLIESADNKKILNCAGANISHNKGVKKVDNEKNLKAFLDTIAKSEGTYGSGNDGYNVMVTGKLFSSYKDHPFTHNDKALHVKGNLYSTAAGRYQIMRVNWYGTKENASTGLKKQLKLNDFSPENQDIAAIALLKRRKAYELILQGKVNAAFNTTSLNKEWASFPGAGYNQQKHNIEKILT